MLGFLNCSSRSSWPTACGLEQYVQHAFSLLYFLSFATAANLCAVLFGLRFIVCGQQSVCADNFVHNAGKLDTKCPRLRATNSELAARIRPPAVPHVAREIAATYNLQL